jgi:GT2 family glycosyltransferase
MNRDRLKSRWRKLRRDPAAFAGDLPSPPLRGLALAGLEALTWLQSIGGAGSPARLSRIGVGDAQADYPVTDAHRLRPGPLEVRGGDAVMVVAAFDQAGGFLAACEARPGRPGILAPRDAPSLLRAYRISGEAPLPNELEVRAISRRDQVARARAEGLSRAEALRLAWPPADRRPAEPSRAAYRAWIARNEPGPADAIAIKAAIGGLPSRPRICVVMPVHDPRPEHLRAAIASVEAQLYEDWSLCVADDGSASQEVRAVLDAATDPRIRQVRLDPSRGVAAATNAALQLAQGELALFLDHDDLLAPHALALVAAAFAHRPELQAVYSDEDGLDEAGRRSAPLFKPDFDGERLLAQNYVNHLFAVRLDLLHRLGGLRVGVDAAQDHDLVLRVAEAAPGAIGHIPAVLYHWRVYPGAGTLSQRQAGAAEARAKVVRDALGRRGETGEARVGQGGYVVVERAAARPSVLAIIPTRDRPALLEACVAGLLDHTSGVDLKLRIVDNGSQTVEARRTLDRLAARPDVEVLRIEAPFNYSALNNAAAKGADADLLALLNDDILVIEPGWLAHMAGLAQRPDVGAVGARLHYPDGRLQHAGLVLGVGPQGIAGHEFRGQPADTPGPQRRLLVTREASAVTAACMVVERAKFEAAGGFDESFAVAFNDVDLCLRLRAKGWRNLWTPHARLIHVESATRGSDADPVRAARFQDEVARMKARWGEALAQDPYYNPNLTIEDESFALARVGRRSVMDLLAGR